MKGIVKGMYSKPLAGQGVYKVVSSYYMAVMRSGKSRVAQEVYKVVSSCWMAVVMYMAEQGVYGVVLGCYMAVMMYSKFFAVRGSTGWCPAATWT